MNQVLIFSNMRDIHATAVAEKMTANHGIQPLILDFSHISRVLSVEALYENSDAQFRFNIGSNSVDLADVKSFWWRRPQPIAVDPVIRDPRHVKFAVTEWDTLLRGIFQSTTGMWVNDITKDQTASHKAYQLAVAKRLQIAIPDTLMTNSPQEAIRFWEKHQGKVIFKAFISSFDAWRETRPLRKEFLSIIDKVRYAPVIFQEFLDSATDIRITCIGSEIYAGETQPASDYQYDWRMSPQATWKTHALPEPVKESLIKFMNALGLQYGAIDMKLTEDGRYVLLEINPAGQFLFLERDTRLPISDAMARLLVAGGN
jgi:glutathione synthase/RimK-type ligase-like ATP-grasp enzyme